MVHLFSEKILVRAEIQTFNGFSSHAGQKELKQWPFTLQNPEKSFWFMEKKKRRLIFKQAIKEYRL
jgi:metallo-beta-lactamase family protein